MKPGVGSGISIAMPFGDNQLDRMMLPANGCPVGSDHLCRAVEMLVPSATR
jgi:hypothetical protein